MLSKCRFNDNLLHVTACKSCRGAAGCGRKYEGPVFEDRAFFDFKISVAQMLVILCKLSERNFGYERTTNESNG